MPTEATLLSNYLEALAQSDERRVNAGRHRGVVRPDLEKAALPIKPCEAFALPLPAPTYGRSPPYSA